MPKKTRSRRVYVLVCASLRLDLRNFRPWVQERLALRHLRWGKSHLQLAPGFRLLRTAAGAPLLLAPTGHEWPLPNTQDFISKIYHLGPHADDAREHQIVY